MNKGIHLKQTKIERHRIGHIILDLLSKGLSYSQIVRDIRVRYNVDISKSAITRFLNKSKEIREQCDKSYDEAFRYHSRSTVKRIERVIHNVRRGLNDINRLLDESSLKPVERSRLKADIKIITNDMLEEYATIESTTLSIMKLMQDNYDSINNLMQELKLCLDCRKKVADSITAYTKRILETK